MSSLQITIIFCEYIFLEDIHTMIKDNFVCIFVYIYIYKKKYIIEGKNSAEM